MIVGIGRRSRSEEFIGGTCVCGDCWDTIPRSLIRQRGNSPNAPQDGSYWSFRRMTGREGGHVGTMDICKRRVWSHLLRQTNN